MRTLVRFLGLPILVGVLFSACMSGDLDVGQGVVKPDEMLLQYIDTVTVNLSTVMIPDSFITSSDSSILVGRWNDSQTGLMSARGFASLAYVGNDLPEQKGIRFDSLVLEVVHAYTVGDSISPFTIQVHQLKQSLEIGAVHYNTQAVAYTASPLLQTTIVPQFKEEIRQVRIRIPEALAKSFYDKLISKEINSAETMAEFWKGMAFLSPSTNNVFLALNLTSSLSGIRLYYRGNDISQTNYNLLFPFQASQFTQLTNNRTGTPLQALQRASDVVSSRLTQNTSFVLPGAFLSTRIEIPSLTEFIKPEKFIGLNMAELIIEPVRRDVRDNAPPPSTLGLYFTNNQNETTDAVPGTSTGATSAVAPYTFLPNAIELEDAYVFNITHYINQVMTGLAVNRPMLLRVPVGKNTMKTMIQRVALGNRKHTTDRIRLKLYVTSNT